MPTIHSSEPYYDDYSALQNYIKVLFQPGKSLQARELTQLQTILQNQVSSIGNHVFKEGSPISGAEVQINNKRTSLALKNNYTGTNVFFNVGDFLNKKIQGLTSNATAIVIAEYEQVEGSGRFDGLVVDIVSGEFVANENLKTIDDGTGSVYSFINPVSTVINSTSYTFEVETISNDILTASVDQGILYANETFLVVQNTNILVDTTSSSGSYKLGYDIVESIVTAESDGSLYDPSAGFSNFNAPGADRHKIDVIFKSYKSADYASIPDTFYTAIEIENGFTIIDQTKVQYNEIMEMLADRQHSTTGNFTTVEFPIEITEDKDGDTTKFNYNIEAGQAFVQGFEIETIHTKIIASDKPRIGLARKVGHQETLDVNFGPYFEVGLSNTGTNSKSYNATYLPDSQVNEIIYFWSNEDGNGQLIGQARVTGLQSRYSKLRVYFSDGDDTDTNKIRNKFSSCRSISNQNTIGAPRFANILRESTDISPILGSKNQGGHLIELEKKFPTSISHGGSISFQVLKTFTSVVSSGVVSITANNANETFDELAIIGIFNNTDNTNISDKISSTNITNAGVESLNITLSDGLDNTDSVDVYVVVDVTSVNTNRSTKTKNTDIVTFVYDAANGNTIPLLKSDIFNITKITDNAGSVDLNINHNLDNGQRRFFYLDGNVSINSGNATLIDTNSYDVHFEYFDHTISASPNVHYFTADSYSENYEDIPSYVDTINGKTYELRNCYDFRRKITQLGTGLTIAPNSNISNVVYDYYVGRKDKIYIDEDGIIEIIEGTPSDNPIEPNIDNDALQLYDIDVPPYVTNIDQIKFERIENRGYTMKDISELEDRISSLEYTSALNSLEQEADNKKITDVNGLDKVKSGIIVDNFTGHGVGDVQSDEHTIAIDQETNSAHVNFKLDNFDLKAIVNENGYITSNVKGNNDFDINDANQLTSGLIQGDHEHLVTLDYSEQILINQDTATETLNVNPYNVFSWNGTVRMLPQSDNWISVTRLPSVNVNLSGNNDGWKALLDSANQNAEKHWGFWRTTWQGTRLVSTSRLRDTVLRTRPRPNDTFETVTRRNLRVFENTIARRRSGWQNQVVPKTIKRSIGDKIVNTSIIHFMRSKQIRFHGHGLKPFTEIKASFDSKNVDTNIIWGGITVDDVAYVGSVDANGGTFGKTDAAGYIWGTFNLPADVFRTGKKSFRLEDANDPINPLTSAESTFTSSGLNQVKQNTIVSTETAEVRRREISENSVQTSRFTNIQSNSSTRSVPTRWRDPLAQSFLISKEGGCFITSIDLLVKFKDPNIPLSIQIVENQNGYPTQTIVPFSNVTMNPSAIWPVGHPLAGEQQIKAIVKSTFGVQSGHANSVDNSLANVWTNVKFSDPIYLKEGTEYSFVLMANSANYDVYVSQVGKKQIGGTNVISKQPYTGVLFKSQNASTWTPDQTRDISFRINRAEFVSNGDYISGYTPATGSKELTAINLNTDTFTPFGTSLKWKGKVSSNEFDIEAKKDIEFREVLTISDAPISLLFKGSLSTTKSHLSPVISRHKTNVIAIENNLGVQVDNIGGSPRYEAGTYVTRKIELAKPADDIRVLFSMYKPILCDVDVYFRTSDAVKQYVKLNDFSVASTSIYENYKDAANQLSNELVSIYHYTSAVDGTIVKKDGSAIIVSGDDTLTDSKLYLKKITIVDDIVDAGHATNTFDQVIIAPFDDIELKVGAKFNWDVATSYNIDEYVILNDKIYKSLKVSNVGNTPSAFTISWKEVATFIVLNDGAVTNASDIQIVEQEALDNWFKMKQTNSDETYVNEVSEYDFEPLDAVEDEFETFTIKIVMKAVSKVSVPVISSFRAIATY